MGLTIDELLEMPCWIIDILPMRVPEGDQGQFFSVDQYYQNKQQLPDIKQKHVNLILKINCYRDISFDGKKEVNPLPKKIAKTILTKDVNIRIGESLISSEADDTRITLYNPDGQLLELVRQLVYGEGLYIWKCD